MATVEKLLDIPVDHYVAIDMAWLKDLVYAVGGIDISNTINFTQDGYGFNIGEVYLNGDKALAYSRMRYDDPNGDYGRQERQRKVLDGLVRKILTISGVTKYGNVLDALGEHMRTDLTFDEMKTIAFDYRSILSAVKQDQLKGEGFMQNEISYQRITEEELTRVRNELKKQMEQ